MNVLNREIILRGYQHNGNGYSEFGIWEVNPPLKNSDYKAVVMWTGLYDKNKVKIFEGDVLEMKRKEVSGNIHHFVVYWDKMKSGFYLSRVRAYPPSEDYLRGEHINAKNKTVIGNIYQNPELLK